MMKNKTYQSRLKAAVCSLLFIVFSLGIISAATAQQTAARPDRGIGPIGTFSASDIDTVNLANGDLNISIPLASLPPMAGGKLSFGFTAVYNSKVWNVVRRQVLTREPPIYNYVEDIVQMADNGGWRIPSGFNLFPRDSHDDFDWVPPGPNDGDSDFDIFRLYPNWHKMFFVTPDGAEHELKPLGFSPFPGARPYLRGYYKDSAATVGSAIRYYSVDGSFIWAKVNPPGDISGVLWEVYMPDGMKIYQRSNGVQHIQDTNGNRIKIRSTTDAGGIVTRSIEDEMSGRKIKTEVSPGSLNTLIWYKTVNGVWANVIVNYGTTLVYGKTYETSVPAPQGGDCVLPVPFPVLALDVVREIILPQTETGVQRKYSFSYNSDGNPVPVSLDWYGGCGAPPNHISQASPGYGSLSEMQMPSGAKANYSYSLTGTHSVNSPDEFARENITTKVLTHDGRTDTWNYTIGGVGTVQGPDGSMTSEHSYPSDRAFPSSFGGPTGLGGLVYKTDYSGKKIVERRWVAKKFDGGDDTSTGGKARFNTVITEEYTTIVGSPSKMSAKTYQYDFNGNMISETDYDWFDPSAVVRDGDFTNLPTGVPASAQVLRVITNSYYNDSTSASSLNVYAKRVIGSPPTPLILNAQKESIVGASDTRLSYDNQQFGIAPIVGNLTKQSVWDNRANKWLDTVFGYDVYGNRTSARDPKNNLTTFVFDPLTHAQPTSITVDPLNATGQQVTSIIYDFSTGLVTRQTDANGKATDIDYTNQLLQPPAPDPFGRPGVVTSPAVTSTVDGVSFPNQRRRTVTKYFDSARQVETISDLKQQADGLLKSRKSSDQVGRVILVESSENGSSYTIKSINRYEQMGRITFTSNPTREDGAATEGWTRSTKDVIGRVVEVAAFKGATQPPVSGTNTNWMGSVTTTYNAEQTTIADQAGKKRRSISDGLGRLKQIDELNDNATVYATTSYLYDVLGNLTQVTQGGQQRQFVYDSLSRLREAFNPEQVENGVKKATVYDYDDASNIKLRTNPNLTTVSFTYDGLNRVATKTLSTGGVWNFSYDTGTNGKGRLISVVRQASTEGCYYDGYDEMGRVTASHQITDGQSYALSYGYDLVGNMTKEVYPSNKEVRTSYDNAGRISGVSRYIGGALDKTYASQMSYTAAGVVSAMRMGNSRWERTSFNSRLQPTQIGLGISDVDSSLLRLDYDFGTTTNNGNVLSQSIIIGATTFSQTYTYDHVNRLKTATEAGVWSQTYSYDQFGNRAVTAGYVPDTLLTPQTLSAFNATTNRLIASGYDSSGNQTQDAAGRTFGYDAESRQTSFNGGAVTYSYDGDGRRVKKIDGTGTTVFVYDAGGQLIAEYTSGAAAGSGTSYLTTDHLGSTRVVTREDGSVKARYDYLPFGEEIPASIGGRSGIAGYGGVDTTRQKFTSKERDSESGLDYFGARYHSPQQGRFTSPDPIFFQKTMLVDPQAWNLYAYVRNNPLKFVDPKGEAIQLLGNAEEREKILEALRAAVGDEAGAYLYENKVVEKDGTVRYFVGIYTNGPSGKGQDFRSLNIVSETFGRIIQDQAIVSISIERPNTSVALTEDGFVTINPAGRGTPAASSSGDFGGRVWLLDPSISYGSLPYNSMNNDRPGMLDAGITLAHELGHVAYQWGFILGPTKDAAIYLENEARKLRDPNAPLRIRHDRNDPKSPSGIYDQKIRGITPKDKIP